MNIQNYIVEADLKITVKNGDARITGYAVFPRRYKELTKIFLFMNHIHARIECGKEYCKIQFG